MLTFATMTRSRIAAGHGAKVALVECAKGGDTKDGGFGGALSYFFAFFSLLAVSVPSLSPTVVESRAQSVDKFRGTNYVLSDSPGGIFLEGVLCSCQFHLCCKLRF